MRGKNQLLLFDLKEGWLEEEIKKAQKAGYPDDLINKARKIVLARLGNNYGQRIKNPDAYFRRLLFKILWNEKPTSKNREKLKVLRRKLWLKSLEKQLSEAGLSEEEIKEKIEKELSLNLNQLAKN